MKNFQDVLTFLGIDFFMLASLFAGCTLLGRGVPLRKGTVWRIPVCVVVTAAWAYSFSYVWWYWESAPSWMGAIVVTKYMGTYLLTVLAVWSCYECGFYSALFVGTTAYVLQHSAERMLEIIQFWTGTLSAFWEKLLLVLLITAVYGAFWALLLRDFSVSDYDQYEDRDGGNVMLLAAAAVVSVVAILEPLIRGEISDSGVPMDRMMCYVNCISTLLSLLALIVSRCRLRESEFRRKNEITRQLLHSERKRYALERDTVEAINLKCHDLRHQIMAWQAGSPVFQAELRSAQELVDIYDSGLKTDNPALDVVLSSKALACAGKQIVLTCIADGRRLAFMDEADLYALFGNILDNAIEAVEKVARPEERLITLTVRPRNAFVLIEQENYYAEEPRFVEGLPLTTKEDHWQHGYGVRSIWWLTGKYNGDLKIRADKGIFHLSIILPLPDAGA